MSRVIWTLVIFLSVPGPQQTAVVTTNIPISQVTHQDTIRIFQETNLDLTSDGIDELITLNAVGPGWRDLIVRLEIRSHADSLLYVRQWESFIYFATPPGWDALSPTERESTVRHDLDKIITNQASYQTDPHQWRPDIGDSTVIRRAIEWDVVTQVWREKYGKLVHEWPSWPEFREIRPDIPQSRIDRLVDELKDKPAFYYYTGREGYYAVAWSEVEQRFVNIYLFG